MALLLGIDTGGTFTDAVIYDDGAEGDPVIAKAKALTTHDRLSEGVGAAVGAVLAQSGVAPGDIGLASISTTLATNALVEGRGGRVCLVFIGFSESDVNRAGLREALGEDPLIMATGGHDGAGKPRAPLDLEALGPRIDAIENDVEGFAVCAIFGVRNPAHEITVRDLIRERTDAPVTCGHELSSKLHGPRTALTCILNARLIGMISDLIAATEEALAERGVTAPLMLVRGDGSLVSADFARARPIETILSGPAASLIGASALTGLEDAIISDIGGTTTDIAILRNGRPRLSPEGATVGGHRTMVDAVAMVTHGLGGDSAVTIDDSRLNAKLIIGPGRRIPVSLLAMSFPELVEETLGRQSRAPTPSAHDAVFVVPVGGSRRLGGLKSSEREALEALGGAPEAFDKAAVSRSGRIALTRLASRGFVRLSGFTPSDAAHVLGLHDAWNREAAIAAAALMARRKSGKGERVAASPEAFARWTIETLQRRSAEALLSAALVEDGVPEAAASAPLIAAALKGHDGAARIDIGSALPVVGLGASAPTYYPAIAALLGADCATPEHAGVANAVGAVAGRIEVERKVRIVPAGEGGYRVLMETDEEVFAEHSAAVATAQEEAERLARGEAQAAGAGAITLDTRYEESAPEVEGKPMFIEGVAIARASGRPAISSPE